MITLIYGENAYERDQQLAALLAGEEAPERYDGGELGVADLPQILQGVSLFSSSAVKIISQLGDNRPVWVALGELLEKQGSDTSPLILLETKPDKRTRTYKFLQKNAQLIECKSFGERDQAKASAWLERYAQQQSISLERPAAAELVQRIGVEQYALLHELQRLSSLGTVTLDIVKTYTEARAHDTAFDLLDLALRGKTTQLQTKLGHLKTSEDAYMTLGLMISQVYALAGAVTGGSEANASELGVHPFVLSKAQAAATSMSETSLREVIDSLATGDMQLKTSGGDPWLAIEVALMRIAEANE